MSYIDYNYHWTDDNQWKGKRGNSETVMVYISMDDIVIVDEHDYQIYVHFVAKMSVTW